MEYGYYPYYSDGTPAPILWRVLDVRQNTALLQSVYALDACYANRYSSLWTIDSVFISSSFSMYNSQTERMMLLANGMLSTADLHNEAFGFSAGSGNDYTRRVEPTPYAASKGLKLEDGYTGYWCFENNTPCRVTPAGSVLKLNYAMTLGVVPTITVDVYDLRMDRGTGTFDDPYSNSESELSLWLWMNMFFDVENAPTVTIDNPRHETRYTYSGPGTHYYRDSVSAINTHRLDVRLLAREGRWAMIEYKAYSTNKKLQSKTAWILESDFGHSGSAEQYLPTAYLLPEFNLTAKTTRQVNLHDDFSMIRMPLYTLWAGQEVDFLGYTCIHSQALAYVETEIYNQPVRGFVPLDCIALNEYDIDRLLNRIGD